jgi:hypothetical protein
MYNTVVEMHIALDQALQHINTNRKQAISVDYKDMALNAAVLQFIENRTNPTTNIRKESKEETRKRVDDIRELKKNFTTSTFKNERGSFIILPYDYLKSDGIAGGVKRGKEDIQEIEEVIKLHVLKFEGDENTRFSNFKIMLQTSIEDSMGIGYEEVFKASDYPNLPEFYGEESKFDLINLILEKNKGKAFWEKYDNVYKPNCLIFVNSVDEYIMSYDSKTITSKLETIKYKKLNTSKTIYNKPIDLISSFDIFEIEANPFYNSNRHLNPIAFIEDNRLYILNGNDFNVVKCSFNYIKKPRLISFRHNITCELTVNREIIEYAVQKLKAYIKDEGYQHQTNENQIVE